MAAKLTEMVYRAFYRTLIWNPCPVGPVTSSRKGGPQPKVRDWGPVNCPGTNSVDEHGFGMFFRLAKQNLESQVAQKNGPLYPELA